MEAFLIVDQVVPCDSKTPGVESKLHPPLRAKTKSLKRGHETPNYEKIDSHRHRNALGLLS